MGSPLGASGADVAEKRNEADVYVFTSQAPKHELQHRWCLWVHQRPGPQKGMAWSESQRLVHEFGTAEDFWCMFHYSYAPSKLEKVKAQSLDELWLSLSLALIGEAFVEHGGELAYGAIVSVRSRASKIALWLSAAKDEKKVMAIGREYRNVLASTPGLQDLATKELTFEDFRKQTVTFVLSRPHQAEATVGVFQ